MYDIREYFRAESAGQAAQLLTQNPGAKVLAGGTDVLVKLRHLDPQYTRLVDIHDLPELKVYALDSDGTLRLGSGLTFTETINCTLVKEYIPVLGEAAATVAGPQIRNMGTIGGNIANGAASADTAAPFLILEPDLEIVGANGSRTVSLQGFHTGPGRVALEQDEILTAFVIKPEKYQGLGAAYYKYAMRSAMDIATIGCAAGVKMAAGRITDLRLALTVAAPTPIRCPAAEAAGLNKPLNEATLKEILEALDQDIKPRTSWRATKEFRTRIIKTLAERLIKSAASRTGGGN